MRDAGPAQRADVECEGSDPARRHRPATGARGRGRPSALRGGEPGRTARRSEAPDQGGVRPLGAARGLRRPVRQRHRRLCGRNRHRRGDRRRALVAEGHLRLAAILINRGDLAGAETELRRCLELAGDLGSHRRRGRGDVVARHDHVLPGHPEEASASASGADSGSSGPATRTSRSERRTSRPGALRARRVAGRTRRRTLAT